MHMISFSQHTRFNQPGVSEGQPLLFHSEVPFSGGDGAGRALQGDTHWWALEDVFCVSKYPIGFFDWLSKLTGWVATQNIFGNFHPENWGR